MSLIRRFVLVALVVLACCLLSLIDAPPDVDGGAPELVAPLGEP